MEDKTFYEWFNKTEETAGSLVTPASAAKMIGITRQYLERLTKAGEIKKYYYDELPFIGMKDIEKIIAKRKKRIEKENRKDILLQKAYEEELKRKINKIRQQKAKEEDETFVPIEENENEAYNRYINYLEDVLAEEKASPFITNHEIDNPDEPEKDPIGILTFDENEEN